MNIQEAAEKYGLSTEELFNQAYTRFGLIFGSAGAVPDHEQWKTWGTKPLYVAKWIRYRERQLVLVGEPQ